eukprot:GHVP01049220.1.p1 GENE.GHVP01049220.1~~GHVP01049220.1.p1  ORF type:complete len:1083 (+),score=156.97 GHVP01049220.1:367-3615(+)
MEKTRNLNSSIKKTFKLDRNISITLKPVLISGYTRYRTYLLFIFIVPMLLYCWSYRFRIYFLTEPSTFTKGTHVVITSSIGTREIVPIESRVLGNILDVFLEQKGTYPSISHETLSIKKKSLRVFYYRKIGFLFNPKSNEIEKIADFMPSCISILERKKYLKECEEISEAIFGKNEIVLEQTSIIVLILMEILEPLMVFQIFMLGVWLRINYELYAGIVFLISLVSITMTVYGARKSQKELRNLAKTDGDSNVLRDNGVVTIKARDLLPGDIVQLDNNVKTVPADILIIEGDVVVSEMLVSGEVDPVLKTAVCREKIEEFTREDTCYNGNVLFTGTEIVEAYSSKNGKCYGIVIGTGFNTMKGEIIQSFLFPKQEKFQYEKDIKIFFIFAFFIGVVVCIFSLIVSKIQKRSNKVIDRALDLISVVIPPALSSVLGGELVRSIYRLKRKDIVVLNSRRLYLFGHIDCVCYDKTGTLTEPSLSVDKVIEYKEEWQTVSPENSSDLFKRLMTKCHSLKYVNGAIVGDGLESQILSSTGTKIEEAIKQSEVIRKLNFSAELRRSGVVIKDDDEIYAYTKGSPEQIHSLSDPLTIPEDYFSVLEAEVKLGHRIIAYGHKKIHDSLDRIETLPRSSFESMLRFVGFVVLENKVREDVPDVIEKLRDAEITQVMCTGDHLQTAVSIARISGLIVKGKPVYYGVMETESKLVWRNIDNGSDEKSMDYVINENVELACTGNVFSSIVKSNSDLSCQKFSTESTVSKEEEHALISRIRVFSRMSPEEKKVLVISLQEAGKRVSFVGDGANDLKAISTADAGLFLSNSEAAMAAPFISITGRTSSIVDLLLEGRCTFTSAILLFKFYILTNAVQLYLSVILHFFNLSLLNNEFIYLDIISVLIPACMMSGFPVATTLSSKRTFTRLFCPEIIISVIFHTTISLVCLIIGIALTRQDGEVRNNPVFILGIHQVIISGFLSFDGRPFRGLRNTALYLYMTFLVVFTFFLTIVHKVDIRNRVYKNGFEKFMFKTGNFITQWVYERERFRNSSTWKIVIPIACIQGIISVVLAALVLPVLISFVKKRGKKSSSIKFI